MAPLLFRRLVNVRFAVFAVASALALSTCAASESNRPSTLRFALSTTTSATTTATAPPIRLGEVRVLSRRVNLQEPILLSAAGGNVTVTFALRQREGATIVLNPTSLEQATVTPYTYSEHAKRATPPFVALEPSHVTLANGGSMSCWPDDQSGRVLAQAFGAGGAWLGSPIAVSAEGSDVFGAPQVIAADSRHAVAVYFVSNEDGFELVAASLEQVRRAMRVQSFARALASAAVLASSLAACAPAGSREAVAVPAIVQGAVSLADGGELRLEETWGHVVVLAFFTTWCPSSPATLRAVEEVRARNAARGLEVIAVGEGATAAEVSAFAVKLGVRARIAFERDGVLARQLGLPTLPAVVVIGTDGANRHVYAGFHGDDDRAAIYGEVTALLEAPIPPSAAEPPGAGREAMTQ